MKDLLVKFFLLSISGSIGTIFRYLLSLSINNLNYLCFPAGTFIVNLLGSFLAGILLGVSNILIFSENLKIFLFIGFLGGFTTFSAFSAESFNLIKSGYFSVALVYIILTNILGIFLTFVGFNIIKFFR